jgi:hypothetical protein
MTNTLFLRVIRAELRAALSSVRPFYRHTKAARELSRAACAMNCRDFGGRVRFRSSIVQRIMRLSDLFDSCFLNSGLHFLDMRPAPLKKPRDPPIFSLGKVTLRVSARKDANCNSFWPGGRREGVQPDEVMSCCAPAGLRVGGSARKQCPPGQNRDPQHPLFSPPTGAALVHRSVRFSPSLVSASTTALRLSRSARRPARCGALANPRDARIGQSTRYQSTPAVRRPSDQYGFVFKLEAEVALFRDRATRAEGWLQTIHSEIEQKLIAPRSAFGTEQTLVSSNSNTEPSQPHAA